MQDSERPQMDASQSGQAPPRVRPGLYSEDPAHGQGRRRDGRRQRQSTATATATATAARAPKKHTERETAGAALPSHARRRIPAAHVAAHYALRFTPYFVRLRPALHACPPQDSCPRRTPRRRAPWTTSTATPTATTQATGATGYVVRPPLLSKLTRAQFISSRGNEYFCEIDEEYLTDRFNLTGLNTEVQYYQYALDLVTDVFDFDCDDEMREQIEKSARHLYGLVHARYIVTTRGLAKMVRAPHQGHL